MSNTRKQTKVVYGGPYADETAAITAESQKEKPNFDELTKEWKTISNGALAYIEQVQLPIKAPVGKFIQNVKEVKTEEVEIPAVVPFITPDEEVIKDDATNETVPEKKEETQTEESLKEFGL
jgi:hypothetical protein